MTMMTATACPPPEQLKALSVGQLSYEQSHHLLEHLDACDACRAELETIGDAEDSLIASLREPDEQQSFESESGCRLAVAKALGALAAAGEEPQSLDHELDLPQRIGEYEITRPLGRGGMGNVYLARHTKLGREVALKVLASNRISVRRMRERFESEMRAVGRLSHPNIVTAHDAREVDGVAVLVTEYIDGVDLGELVQRVGPLAVPEACEITRQVAVALQYTSSQGFVHRDVKPSNVMLSRTGEVKLLDLGLARLQFGDPESGELTATGQAMGTADYIAPEQVTDSRSVDVRADIYALGCTLMKLLTGRAPFAEESYATAFAKMTAHVSTPPPKLKSLFPAAPAGLATLVDAMLSKSPEKRPQSPRDIAEALTSYCVGADLTGLATRGIQAQPSAAGVSQASKAPAAQTDSFWNRRVPLMAAIGGAFFSLLVGLCLGILIKIRYPDGTEMEVQIPAGSEVTTEFVPDDASRARAETNGSPGPSGLMPMPQDGFRPRPQSRPGQPQPRPSRNPLAPTPPTAPIQGGASVPGPPPRWLGADEPLKFGVLVSSDLDSAKLDQARAKLHQVSEQLLRRSQESSVAKYIIDTPAGIWFPIDGDAPATEELAGQPYALVSNEPDAFISWNEIRDGISITSSFRDGKQTLGLGFSGKLAERMEELTRKHEQQQLAIILENRVVSAPRIASTIRERAEITGDFQRDALQRLFQALNGGLVEPPTRPQADVERVEENPFYGTWQVTQVQQGGHRMPVERTPMVFVFHEDRYSVVIDGQMRDGLYSIDTTASPPEIDFSEGVYPKTPKLGIYRVLDDGQLQIALTESGDRRPTQFETSPSDPFSVITMRRTSDRPLQLAVEQVGAQRSENQDRPNTPPEALTKNNLRQIGLAFHNFHDVYKKFPGSSNRREGSVRVGDKEVQPFSWRVAILPFIEHNDLFEKYRFDETWDSEHNKALLEQMPAVYRSPFAADELPAGETNYLGFAGKETALGTDEGVRMTDIRDGTSNTLLIIESRKSVPWTKPEDIPYTGPEQLEELVEPLGGVPLHYLRVDGSVDALPSGKVDWELLNKLITRDGGEVIQRAR